ncbi:type II toxin-antitoxin system RelE/ParE family toxin [Nocardia sp. IBHARD005]|uniref:type II toxin-antitoxin system RelE/ParE family toxin n=1 Tax=Nocardia sp. IBHARD005 TaxID=3457765 RepID=UPI004059ABF2
MLAERATTLIEPWSRNLGDGVRELRFHLHPREFRITYWLAPGRRIVLLTVFRKTGDRRCNAGQGTSQGMRIGTWLCPHRFRQEVTDHD